MAELTRDDVKSALAETIRSGVLDEYIRAIARTVAIEVTSDKLEKTLGVNCFDQDRRAETRKDMEHVRETRSWSESEEGKATISALTALAKMLGTKEGEEKLATLESLATTLNSTERWLKSRFARAAIIGFFVLAGVGLTSIEAFREIGKSLMRALQ